MRILSLSLVSVLFWKWISCASCPTLLPLSFFLFLLCDCLPRPHWFHLCAVNQSLLVYLSLFARLSHPFVTWPQVTQCAFLPAFLALLMLDPACFWIIAFAPLDSVGLFGLTARFWPPCLLLNSECWLFLSNHYLVLVFSRLQFSCIHLLHATWVLTKLASHCRTTWSI